MAKPDLRHQTVKCPVIKDSYRLFDGDFLYEGQEFTCIMCWRRHVATKNIISFLIPKEVA